MISNFKNKNKTNKTKTEQINKMKSWFFERINKTEKPLARFIKREKRRIQISKVTNERVKVTNTTTEIQIIIKEYYEPTNWAV